MVSLSTLSTIALMIASGVIAAPWNPAVHAHTHRARGVGPTGVQLTSYHPPSGYGVDGVDPPPAKRGAKRATPDDVAKRFLQDKLGVAADALARHSGHSFDGVSYEYFSQIINGVPIANAVANVAMKGDKIVSYGASFINPRTVAPAIPTLTAVQAIAKAEQALGGKHNDWPTELKYFATDSDHVALAHVIQIQNMHSGEWKQAYVDANNGELVNVVDFVADASYRVIPLQNQDLREDGFKVVNDPQDPNASPDGWHKSKKVETTETVGNNAVSYKGLDQNLLVPISRPNDPISRLVFAINDNYGKGGKEGDRVQVSVQDSTGTNNANFATPPDGQTGQMRMFTWTLTTPNRDGALENDIVVHEMTHGISNRLTGGGTGECLQTTESGGMGEGWSDAMADITECKISPVPDFTLGSYVTNNTKGIRTYPYSTNNVTNPFTYSSLATKNEVHAIGEVWALMLHEVLAALVEKWGLSEPGHLKDPNSTKGNNVMLHLFMDGLKLQPCNPTFISARDAIIQADKNRYDGANECLLWKAFAKRGLGKAILAHLPFFARRWTEKTAGTSEEPVGAEARLSDVRGAWACGKRARQEEFQISAISRSFGADAIQPDIDHREKRKERPDLCGSTIDRGARARQVGPCACIRSERAL
ncbi:hypothetical protein FRC06_005569 [Ceratobasidium sp. 370]|nr:hypothetical protein FRC06_005569 [Ceratobasidium sp. 370]